jgi:putative holliday junction resolvase
MILGVDPGSRRVGLAIADDETRLARPLEVIDTSKGDAIPRIVAIASELGARAIVVGQPVSMSGHHGPAMDSQKDFVARLRAATPVLVIEHDERLTTVVADQGLLAAGAKTKARARIRDAVAAQVMLQGYLDSEPKA